MKNMDDEYWIHRIGGKVEKVKGLADDEKFKVTMVNVDKNVNL